MSNFKLNLPTDIPWKRLCVSNDMIDTKLCDKELPLKWRSSIAVFGFEPEEEFQEFEDQIISYVKVTCTITGYQPDPKEVGLHDRFIENSWTDATVIENYKEIVSKYYGCYGAILQVSVAPKDVNVKVDKYPYFADFDPKKRELYELVSETGETMSRSLSGVNVMKGSVSTDSQEVLDISQGFSVSGQGEVAGTGGGGSFSRQGQWGTRNINSEEYSNVRTTDQGNEKRESFSHSTQLSQMYHQLSSYHIGTNRAAFFMLPRPHIIQSEATFVNGPRLLEGVQEFFLVVARPKEVKEICLEANLETAHILNEPQFKYEQKTDQDSLSIRHFARDAGGDLGNDSVTTFKEDSVTYVAPSNYEIDLEREGGFRIETVSGERIVESGVRSVTLDSLVIYGKVSARFVDKQWPKENEFKNGSLDIRVTIFLKAKKPDIVGYDQNLYLTGRNVCCCKKKSIVAFPNEYVVFESPLKLNMNAAVGLNEVFSIKDANAIRGEIGNVLYKSMNAYDRYPIGKVGFAQLQCVSNVVGNIIREKQFGDNIPLKYAERVDEKVLEKILKIAPNISKGKILEMSLQEQSDRFSLKFEEVVKLRSAVLGITSNPLPPHKRWDSPAKTKRKTTK